MDKDQTGKRLEEIYDRFSASTKPVHRAYIESIHALVNLTEARDPYTKRHAVKVSNYAVLLARHMGLPKEDIDNVRLAAILHDIGKLGVKEKILMKPSSLTSEEYEEVKKHPGIAVEIVKPLKFFGGIVLIIKHHHENYDGTGYPDGLKGKDIPLGAQLLAIVDVYDALISKRAYRKAYSHEEALKRMKEESGKKFDPELLKNFIACLSSKNKENAK